MPERESEKDLTEQTQLDSTLKSVDTAEAIVLKAAKQLGFDEDDQHQIGMAVRECMVNAVVHGNRYSAHKKVHLAISSVPGGIAVTIGDEGSGFDHEFAARSAGAGKPVKAIRAWHSINSCVYG